ncbi:uncharacterized protein FA14DRAFT_176309 [Meira miltonrushii]|uniref:Uncharacterized protein n=1 Tax=Meira miltonrushii TaxID=1280837 RepID=A0A316VH73_9BASI|nr:uncharacterized protein FA14DRAFT_176309 [Meira miltonrushii]PWN37007.1 hypothetical protein FA14DRAFT_176309 [Meira miltonrushii]
MILAEVQRVTSILQDELKRSKRSASKTAILEEAWMITFVLCGMRCSGLLAKLQTDKETISALANALSRILVKDVEDLLILVHVPSQQTFIANRELLAKQLKRSKVEHDHAFLAVDQLDADAEAHITAPSSLKMMLEEIENDIERKGRTSVQIISLTLLNPTKSSAGAKTGVALAGWLLEYPLVYHFRQSENVQLQATPHSISSIGDLFSNSLDDWDGSSDMQTNNLAGKDLTVFYVNLSIKSELEIVQNILQFTIPVSVLHPTAEAIGILPGSIEEIKQHLTKLFQDRIQGQKSDQLSIRVDTKQIRMDRVAI